ncbi:MAG TPA: CAP domain-containing protein [Actinomycetota bacterium]|jgi:uncharacterized protein YkwD|nr:CAP domain-containing protein [Actinomycetota bacterium]
MSRTGVAAVVSAAAVLTAIAVPTASSARAGSAGCYSFSRAERAFAARIDRARAAHGLRRLHLDKQLSRAARKHSWEMRRARTLFHTTPAQARRRITRWRSLGENVGRGYSTASLHRAFMASAPHRHNVLTRGFRHVGVSVVKQNGVMWVTIIFESRRDPGTTLPMPAC